MSLGTTSLVQTTVESVTTAGLLTSAAGSTTQTTTANVAVTGIGLTGTLGTSKITSWSEINTNANNVWSEVDLAA